MAYTFDEILANAAPIDPEEYDEVLTTLVVTQEDGRTAYAAGWFAIDYGSRVLKRGVNNADPAFDLFVSFSDRNRFQGASDAMGIQISSIGLAVIRANISLKSWGNVQFAVDLTLPANFAAVGKVYQGWGETIGNGSGRALHCLAFNEIHRNRVMII